MLVGNRLKRRVAAGERLYGAWISTGSTANAELLAAAGYDFLIVDQEHGAGSIQTAIDLMRACLVGGAEPIVRVPWNDQVYLKRILDAGATSIMIPMIENEEEAKAAVAASLYPPYGRRGYAAPAMRCSSYGADTGYRANWHENLFLIAQIESAGAAERAESIAAVDGVDMVLITLRNQAMDTDLFTQLGCAIGERRVVVVKSSQHFHASYSKVAGRIIYVDAPGSVTKDLATLGHRHVARPKWPLDADAVPVPAVVPLHLAT